ncbi:MAG TPA: hypothetical protein VI168_19285 [Croceibacterium sp.]
MTRTSPDSRPPRPSAEYRWTNRKAHAFLDALAQHGKVAAAARAAARRAAGSGAGLAARRHFGRSKVTLSSARATVRGRKATLSGRKTTVCEPKVTEKAGFPLGACHRCQPVTRAARPRVATQPRTRTTLAPGAAFRDRATP